jgi:23S rRNA (pseudouridine1915-N3)-methyltransferase
MRLTILAIGKLKIDAERALIDRFDERLRGIGPSVHLQIDAITELSEGRHANVEARRDDEAHRLLAKLSPTHLAVALDEAGPQKTSSEFADWLVRLRDGGERGVTFLIGGPDGHGTPVLSTARARLSLSAMTLPHGLARVVLLEQLYRAATLIGGHPYHRA